MKALGLSCRPEVFDRIWPVCRFRRAQFHRMSLDDNRERALNQHRCLPQTSLDSPQPFSPASLRDSPSHPNLISPLSTTLVFHIELVSHLLDVDFSLRIMSQTYTVAPSTRCKASRGDAGHRLFGLLVLSYKWLKTYPAETQRSRRILAGQRSAALPETWPCRMQGNETLTLCLSSLRPCVTALSLRQHSDSRSSSLSLRLTDAPPHIHSFSLTLLNITVSPAPPTSRLARAQAQVHAPFAIATPRCAPRCARRLRNYPFT